MAKLTKGMLKGIVKECLVEILSEGIGGVAAAPLVEATRSRRRPTQQSSPHQKRKTSIFDQMDRSFAINTPVPKQGFNEAVHMASKMATDNPILQEILTNTAKTTLQDQLQHEPRGGMASQLAASNLGGMQSDVAPIMSQAAAGLDIESLFGDVTNNWSEVLERTEAKKLP